MKTALTAPKASFMYNASVGHELPTNAAVSQLLVLTPHEADSSQYVYRGTCELNVMANMLAMVRKQLFVLGC